MPSNDLMAWLGLAAEDMTVEQIEAVAAAGRDIEQRYPEPDDQPQRDAALSAAVQYLLGETTPDGALRRLSAARHGESVAYAAALQVAVMHHRYGGAPKAVAAREAGVDRMSLLKALGER